MCHRKSLGYIKTRETVHQYHFSPLKQQWWCPISKYHIMFCKTTSKDLPINNAFSNGSERVWLLWNTSIKVPNHQENTATTVFQIDKTKLLPTSIRGSPSSSIFKAKHSVSKWFTYSKVKIFSLKWHWKMNSN